MRGKLLIFNVAQMHLYYLHLVVNRPSHFWEAIAKSVFGYLVPFCGLLGTVADLLKTVKKGSLVNSTSAPWNECILNTLCSCHHISFTTMMVCWTPVVSWVCMFLEDGEPSSDKFTTGVSRCGSVGFHEFVHSNSRNGFGPQVLRWPSEK